MPIYEYQCQQCGQPFEKFFRSLKLVSTDVTCPACHSSSVQRLMSAAAVHSGRSAPAAAEALASSDSDSDSSPVFGRKELKQAEEQKRQIKEQIKYEKEQARKKK